MEERTITVSGQSKLTIPPDSIAINMTLTTLKEEYNEAIEAAGEDLNELRKCLNSVGFTKEEIKTTDFQVNTRYENVKDNNDNFKRVFKGYEVINRLRVEFPEDPIKLAKVLNSLSFCSAKPEFSISYEIKDKKEFEERLIQAAIIDATSKAEKMVATAGVKLGKLIKIDGGNSFIGINNRLMGLKLSVSDTSLDLEPANITGEASVTMMWRIE